MTTTSSLTVPTGNERPRGPSIENYFVLQRAYQYQEISWERIRVLDLIIDTYQDLRDNTAEFLYTKVCLAR